MVRVDIKFTKTTAGDLKALGAELPQMLESKLMLDGASKANELQLIDARDKSLCQDSGVALKYIIPILCAFNLFILAI